MEILLVPEQSIKMCILGFSSCASKEEKKKRKVRKDLTKLSTFIQAICLQYESAMLGLCWTVEIKNRDSLLSSKLQNKINH